MTTTAKKFDAVAFQRKVRKKMSKVMRDMTFEERHAFIQKRAIATRSRTAPKKANTK